MKVFVEVPAQQQPTRVQGQQREQSGVAARSSDNGGTETVSILEPGTPIAFTDRLTMKYAIVAGDPTMHEGQTIFRMEVITYFAKLKLDKWPSVFGWILYLIWPTAMVEKREILFDLKKQLLYKVDFAIDGNEPNDPSIILNKPADVLKRAKSRIGEKDFSRKWNYSQDFVHWCCIQHPINRDCFRIQVQSQDHLNTFIDSQSTAYVQIDGYDEVISVVKSEHPAPTEDYITLTIKEKQIEPNQQSVVQKYCNVKKEEIQRTFGGNSFFQNNPDKLHSKVEQLMDKSLVFERHLSDEIKSAAFCNWLRLSTCDKLEDFERLKKSNPSYCMCLCCSDELNTEDECKVFCNPRLKFNGYCQCTCCGLGEKLVRCCCYRCHGCCCGTDFGETLPTNNANIGDHVLVEHDGRKFHMMVTHVNNDNSYTGVTCVQLIPCVDTQLRETIVAFNQLQLLTFNQDMEHPKLSEALMIQDTLLTIIDITVKLLLLLTIAAPLFTNDTCALTTLFRLLSSGNENALVEINSATSLSTPVPGINQCPWEKIAIYSNIALFLVRLILVTAFFLRLVSKCGCCQDLKEMTYRQLAWELLDIFSDHSQGVGLLLLQLYLLEAKVFQTDPDVVSFIVVLAIGAVISIFIDLILPRVISYCPCPLKSAICPCGEFPCLLSCGKVGVRLTKITQTDQV